MKTYNNIYPEIYSLGNLLLAWRKTRKGKTKKSEVKKFEKETLRNLLTLHNELKNQTYSPRYLTTFILHEPKTRKIAKSDFKDRVVHHALVRVIEPIFERTFIYDSCANRKEKGNLFAIKRLDEFMKKVSHGGTILKNDFEDNNFIRGYCLKADVKHYFQEVNHNILLSIIKRKIIDEDTIWLIEVILNNGIVLGGGAKQAKECLLEISPRKFSQIFIFTN
ncbi:MAG: hypothetical protein ABII03_05675 [Nanoarchaeota archaeon]